MIGLEAKVLIMIFVLLFLSIIIIFLILRQDKKDSNYYAKYIQNLKNEQDDMLNKLKCGNREIDAIEFEILKCKKKLKSR